MNAINWFEIPVKDFERANKFYATILAAELAPMQVGDSQMGVLPAGKGGLTGAIIKEEGLEPANKGIVLYLNAGDDLNDILNRVEGAGGKVLSQKTQVSPEIGFVAYFLDTEGNKLGLHSGA